MYSKKQYIELEQEERKLTDESILAMNYILNNTKGNLESELRRFYQKYGTDGVVTYAEARKYVSEQNHKRRLTALFAYVAGEFAVALSNTQIEFEKLLKAVIGKETGFFNVEIDVDKILNTKWGVDNAIWLQRLIKDVNLWNANITCDWKRAILQQKHLDEVLKLLYKRFDSIDSIITSLGLSESTAIGSLSRQQIFKVLGIKSYQFYTNPDELRCETCGSMHGNIYPISAYEVGVTASPIHPRCRCWEVPIWE